MFLFSIYNDAIFDTFVPSFPNITCSRKLDIDTIQNVYSNTQKLSYTKSKNTFFILVPREKPIGYVDYPLKEDKSFEVIFMVVAPTAACVCLVMCDIY